MDIFTLGFYGLSIGLFILSLKRGKTEVTDGMKKTKNMMKGMVPDILAILFLIGLILTFIPPQTIESVLGSENTLMATLISALAGSITLIPAFVAFPLVGSFVEMGASLLPAVAFLTTLTMVGAVTFPLEQKEFGTTFALTRNLLSFGMAIGIAVMMGVIL